VLPNEKHEFSVGWQAAQQDRPVGCTLTLGWAGGLHIKLAYGKGRAGELSFSAACPFPQLAGPPFCAARPSVFSAAH